MMPITTESARAALANRAASAAPTSHVEIRCQRTHPEAVQALGARCSRRFTACLLHALKHFRNRWSGGR
jgi:hypothetical protein